MKKYLALILALLMVFSCAACGGGADDDAAPSDTTPSDTTPSDTTPSDATPSDSTSAEDESAVVLVAEESGEGFPCVLLDNGSVFWAKGATCAQVIDINDLKDAPMAMIEVVDGQIHIIGDEIPDWFLEEEEDMTQVVMDAMAEWEVAEEIDLSDLEYKGPDVVDPISIEAESTEEGNIFACVVMDNGHVEWAEGVTLPSEYGVENPNSAMVQIAELPNGAWEMMVVGEIPEWFNDDIIKNVKEAFATWLGGGEAEEETVAVEGPVVVEAESTEGGRMFACAVIDNGHVFWEQDITVPSELGQDGAALVQIAHLPGNIWEMHVVGEIPGWFDDTVIQNVKDAFGEWMAAG